MTALATLAVAAGVQLVSVQAYATEQAQQRQEARDTKQTGRQDARDEKAECRARDEKSRPECRQEKRDTARDIKRQ